MDINFTSVEELYKRVYPALRSKVKEFRRNDINYIKEEDVWNCLVEKYWKKQKGLLLSDVVDDILNTDNKIIEDFVKEEMKKVKREANVDEEII